MNVRDDVGIVPYRKMSQNRLPALGADCNKICTVSGIIKFR